MIVESYTETMLPFSSFITEFERSSLEEENRERYLALLDAVASMRDALTKIYDIKLRS